MSLRLLNIARTALLAHRTALEVVGQNTANVQTPGYTRQRPVLQALPSAVPGQAGGGVEVADIQRLTDSLLTAQIRYHAGWLGQEQAARATLEQVEQIFTDLAEGGLAGRLEEMFDAWGDLGLQATSVAAREQVIQRAALVAETIAARWSGLYELRAEIDQRVATTVAQVNRLAQQVTSLNKHIAGTSDAATRNDLLNQRDSVINQLASLCGAEVIPQANDMVDVLIGGLRLVQLDQITPLSLVPDPAQPGLHLIALGDITLGPELRGDLAGRLQVRDQIIPQYMEQLDALAQSLADQLNAQHRAGFDLASNPAGDFFVYDPASPAWTLQVSPEMVADPARVGAASSSGQPGDGSNALAIEDLRNARVMAGGAATLSEYSADLVAHIGLDAATTQTRVDARQSLVDHLEASYSSRTGVSLDEEALELVRFQQAYMAAGRLLGVALQMMEQVVQLK